jgi:hypothetical protein
MSYKGTRDISRQMHVVHLSLLGRIKWLLLQHRFVLCLSEHRAKGIKTIRSGSQESFGKNGPQSPTNIYMYAESIQPVAPRTVVIAIGVLILVANETRLEFQAPALFKLLNFCTQKEQAIRTQSYCIPHRIHAQC